MNFEKFELYKDQFNIYNLITKIDVNYRLIFDRINKQFLIINIAKNYQSCLNFKSFNKNIVFLLQKSRIENSQKLFNFIENYNENLNKKLLNNKLENTSNKLKEISKVYNRLNTISIKKTKQIIGDYYA